MLLAEPFNFKVSNIILILHKEKEMVFPIKKLKKQIKKKKKKEKVQFYKGRL